MEVERKLVTVQSLLDVKARTRGQQQHLHGRAGSDEAILGRAARTCGSTAQRSCRSHAVHGAGEARSHSQSSVCVCAALGPELSGPSWIRKPHSLTSQ